MDRSELNSDVVLNAENEAFVYAMWMAGLQNFINTALELNLFEIISNSNKPLTASEIASYLPKYNPEKTPALLDRMLRLFATFSLLHCITRNVGSLKEPKVQRYYDLTQASRFFIKGRKDGGSVVPLFMLQNIDLTVQNIRHNLTDAFIGVNPCESTYGLPLYEVLSQHPESNIIFNAAMAEMSNISMKHLTKNYKGFDGIKILVDIGGGNGTNLKSIISANPHIKQGLNFDLPHVVKDASLFPGITHVGGHFFSGVPKGDAIMIKSVLHSWDDENWIKILKSCYEATPEDGKVIVIDFIIPSAPTGHVAKLACLVDCHMFYVLGAKERTEEEFLCLGRASG